MEKSMASLIQWIIANKEWVFSGIGLSLLTILIGFFKKKRLINQSKKNGNNSTNIQAGQNIRIKNELSKTKKWR